MAVGGGGGEAMTTRAIEPAEAARRFVLCYLDPRAHVEARDAERLFREIVGDTITIWHAGWQSGRTETVITFDGAEYVRRFFGKLGTHLSALMPDYRLVDVRFFGTEDGSALSQTIVGTAPDGTPVCIPQVQFLTLEDGKVTRIDTYVDESQTAVLSEPMRELRAAREGTDGRLMPISVVKDHDVVLGGYE